MVSSKLKMTGLAVALALGSVASEPAVRFGKFGAVTESYVVVITPGYPGALTAWFDVVNVAGHQILHKEVLVKAGPFLEELLSLEESTVLLKKFRSFDWSVKPRERPRGVESSIGCSFGPPHRMAFRAWVDGTCREIEADPLLIPALADLIEVILSKGAEPHRTTEPAPPRP